MAVQGLEVIESLRDLIGVSLQLFVVIGDTFRHKLDSVTEILDRNPGSTNLGFQPLKTLVHTLEALVDTLDVLVDAPDVLVDAPDVLANLIKPLGSLFTKSLDLFSSLLKLPIR